MKIIFFHSFLFIFIIYVHGFIFLNKILRINRKNNFYEISLIGLVISIFFAQFLNFFIPLNDNLLIFNIVLLLIYSIFFYKILIKDISFNLIITIPLLLVAFVNIYGSGFSDDINHYHYSYIANADVGNFIWGNSFLHPLYGTNPTWLTAHSYLNFDQFKLQDIHVLNGIILFLVLGSLFLELYSKSKEKFYYPILFSVILFILLKYTRLKEFGIDRPSTLLFCFLIFYYLKYFLSSNKNELLKNFIIICLLSLCIFSIKIIHLPILLFPLIIFYKNRSILFKKDSCYLILLLPIKVIIFKNLLGSGCLLYPLASSCIDFFSWSNFIGANELTISAEIFNKSWHSYTGSLNKENYIKNFNWFNTWLIRSYVEILELILLSFLIVFITVFSFSLKFKKKKYLMHSNSKDFTIILFLIIISSILIYLLKNPVIRMYHFVIISLMILIISSFLTFEIEKYKNNFMTTILIFGIIFNLSKNFLRISKNDFINNPYSMISEKVSKQEKNNIGTFKYYIGWFGNAPIGNTSLKDKRFKKIFNFKIIY